MEPRLAVDTNRLANCPVPPFDHVVVVVVVAAAYTLVGSVVAIASAAATCYCLWR